MGSDLLAVKRVKLQRHPPIIPWYPVSLQKRRQSNRLPPGCLATADEVGPHRTSAAINIAHEVYVNTETFGDITKTAEEETCKRDFPNRWHLQQCFLINLFNFEKQKQKVRCSCFNILATIQPIKSLHVHVRCCDWSVYLRYLSPIRNRCSDVFWVSISRSESKQKFV